MSGADDWAGFLSRELGRPVRVRVGQARSHVLRYRRAGSGETTVNMSAFFLEAPAPIRAAVAAWMRSGSRARLATRALDDWIRAEIPKLPPGPRRAIRLQAKGRVHDLEALAATLWEQFPGLARRRPGITWGTAAAHPHLRLGGRLRRRRTLRLGSYHERTHLVRVHRALDRESVPEWFVRYILFHELLHAEIGIRRDGKRRVIHGPEFRRRELAYPDATKAFAWEKKHLRQAISE